MIGENRDMYEWKENISSKGKEKDIEYKKKEGKTDRKKKKKDEVDLGASDVDAAGEGNGSHGHHVGIAYQVPRPGNPAAGGAGRAEKLVSKPKFPIDLKTKSFSLEVTIGVDWHLIGHPNDAIEEVAERQVEDEDGDRAGHLDTDEALGQGERRGSESNLADG